MEGIKNLNLEKFDKAPSNPNIPTEPPMKLLFSAPRKNSELGKIKLPRFMNKPMTMQVNVIKEKKIMIVDLKSVLASNDWPKIKNPNNTNFK